MPPFDNNFPAPDHDGETSIFLVERGLDFFTVAELANVLRCSHSAVYKHYENGQIPGFKLCGKVVFLKSDIHSWILHQRSTQAYLVLTEMNQQF